MWWSEAHKYGVLPLVNAPLYGSYFVGAERPAVSYKTLRDPRSEYVFYPEQGPMLRIEAPVIGTGSFSIDVDLKLSTGSEAGVLVADGDRFGGYAFYVKDGHVTFEQSDLGDRSKLMAGRPLTANVGRVRFVFERTDDKGGEGTIFYDDIAVGSGRIARRATLMGSYAGFSVGYDTSGPVSDSYPDKTGFALPSGRIDRVVFRHTGDNHR